MATTDASPALTPWFPADAPPVREGVYRRRFPGGPYSCWSADRWWGDARSAAAAAQAREPSPRQDADWRGLAVPPGEPCEACRGHGVLDRGWDEERALDLIEECPEC